MKMLILLCGILLLSQTSFSQDSTRVEQYCQLVATARLLSNKVTISIDYGEEASIWKDRRVKDESGKATKFNSVVDALNFMGKNGWKLLNAFPVSVGSGPMVYHYVFKKDFPIEETQ